MGYNRIESVNLCESAFPLIYYQSRSYHIQLLYCVLTHNITIIERMLSSMCQNSLSAERNPACIHSRG